MFDVQRDYLSARRLDLPAKASMFKDLLAQDAQAAVTAFQLARSRNDLAGVLAGGGVLYPQGLLPEAEKPAYATALMAERHLNAAVKIWFEAVAANPDDVFLRYHLAECLAGAGRFEEAERVCAKLLRRRPDFVRAKNLKRRAHWLPQRMAEADQWPSLRALVEGCLMVGATEEAERWLDNFVVEPPAGAPTPDDALRLAEAALVAKRPKAAKLALRQTPRAAVDPVRYDTASISLATQLDAPKMAVGRAKSALRNLSGDAELSEGAIKSRRRLRYHAAEAWAAYGRAHTAASELGRLLAEDRRDFAVLTGLQRAMGDAVLGRMGGLQWAEPRPPKIINLLPFYNERLLLELRLSEMGDWVDHFVVVEAANTFTGQPKPLNFAALRPQYGDRGDQLLSVAIEEFPEWCDSAWARDFYQRDYAVNALNGLLRPDDIVLITDADEIVDRRALDGFWPHLASLRMVTSKHFLNYRALPGNPHANRRSGAICRGEHLARFGSTYIRTGLGPARKIWEAVPAAGWHFTSIGEAQTVVQKLTAYAHQEESKAGYRDIAVVSGLLEQARNGVYEAGWSAIRLDDTFPRFVRENHKRLAPLLLPA